MPKILIAISHMRLEEENECEKEIKQNKFQLPSLVFGAFGGVNEKFFCDDCAADRLCA